MAEGKAILLRAGALFSKIMEKSAARSGGQAVRIGLAAAASTSSSCFAEAEDIITNTAEIHERPKDVAQERKAGSMVKSVGEQLSFGGVLGFAAGFSIRKVGKAILFLVGTEVVVLQYMAYREWLTMDWRKLGRDIAPRFDKSTWDGFVEILVYKMPFSAAFSGGLVAGLRFSSAK